METMPEKEIYNIWLKQDFKTDFMLTTGGDSIRVIYPGDLNINDGPDFHNAKLTINGREQVGDIETHIESVNWFRHGHNKDPVYDNVILHVVFKDSNTKFRTETFSSRRIPTLVISKYLIYRTLNKKYDSDRTMKHTLPCYQLFQRTSYSREKLTLIFENLGFQKLLEKLSSIKERIDKLPYFQRAILINPLFPKAIRFPIMDQLLYEKLMECMGYYANRIPFRILAESLYYSKIRKLKDAPEISALLLGRSGLINRCRNRSIAALWTSLKSQFGTELNLYWNYSHCRPYNFPENRIIAISHILAFTRSGIFGYFFKALKSNSLNALLKDPQFTGTLKKNVIGRNLINILLINAVFPHLFFWAIISKKRKMQKNILGIYSEFPPLPENNIIKKVRSLLNVQDPELINKARIQLGLIYLYNNFCSKFKCEVCPISHEFG